VERAAPSILSLFPSLRNLSELYHSPAPAGVFRSEERELSAWIQLGKQSGKPRLFLPFLGQVPGSSTLLCLKVEMKAAHTHLKSTPHWLLCFSLQEPE
jgi:hypothetical protein